MKDIKTKTKAKNIKKLDRFSSLTARAKAVGVRSKHDQTDRRGESGLNSTVEYAQAKTANVVMATLKNGTRISAGVSKRMVHFIQKKQALSPKTINRKPSKPEQTGGQLIDPQVDKKNITLKDGQAAGFRSLEGSKQGSETRHSAIFPKKTARSLHLRKPVEGEYPLSSGSSNGKQRFIKSRANARLLYRTQPSESKGKIEQQQNNVRKPAEKHATFTGTHAQTTGARRRSGSNRYDDRFLYPNTDSAGYPELDQRHDIRRRSKIKSNRTPALSSIVRARSERHSIAQSRDTRISPPLRLPPLKSVKDHPIVNKRSIKMSGKLIKALSRSAKPAYQRRQDNGQAHDSSEKMKQKARNAQRAAFRITASRRSIQRMQAIAKFNIRMVRVAVKFAALLAKGLTALLGISSSLIILMCIILAVSAVLSSPFGIFVSNENTDSDVLPLSQIVQEMDTEFAARLEDIRHSAGSVDRVETHYPGSADNTRIDNWRDIIAVFAVKTVMDTENGMDVATLDATRVDVIRSVFWDMNQLESYIETIEHKETTIVEHEDGSTSEETITRYESVLHITITSQTAEQQAHIYEFTGDQKELMEEMLSEEFRPLMFAILGKDTDVGLSPDQLELIYHDLPEGEWGGEAVKLALTRLGDPYSQPKAGQGRYTDCSYLVQWVYKQLGIQLPRTAAEQARHMVENGLTIRVEDLSHGDLVFWSYERNGRFMDITHVGIYAGNGKVIDASSTRGQVVYRNLFDADKQVMYGRPEYIETTSI